MDTIFYFAGLDGFQDIPLKNYSSGMVMRLGFSLATITPPDVLLVDEALAVGDASFQQKCIQKFREFQSHGTTTIVVSHDLNLLSTLCTRIILLDKGKLIFDGNPNEAIYKYMQIIANQYELQNTKNSLIDEFEFWEWWIEKNNLKNPQLFFVGEVLELKIRFCLKKPIPQLTIGFHLDDSRGVRVFGTNTYHLGLLMNTLEINKIYEICFQIPLNIGSGKYSMGISLHQGEAHSQHCYFWGESMYSFEVERLSQPKFIGTSYLPVSVDLRFFN